MYLEYVKYVMENKKNVFKTCWKKKMDIHAFTHDLSKFLHSEFIPYAEYFYGEDGVKLKNNYIFHEIPINEAEENLQNKYKICKEKFDIAWEHHYKNNKHHWNYWIGRKMPSKYIIQMICDWEAMALKFGDTAQEFYMKNYDNIILEVESRCELEFHLNLIPSECWASNVTWKQACKGWKVTMEEDLKNIGYIK